mgnify:CR=1 FL=1
MKKRLLTFTIACMVLAIAWYFYYFRLLLTFMISILGIIEWQKCLRRQGVGIIFWPIMVCLLFVSAIYYDLISCFYMAVLALVVNMCFSIVVLFLGRLQWVLHLSIVPWLLITPIFFTDIINDASLFVSLLLVAGGFDSWSLLFGRWFGQTLIAPSISPNKTFEGVIGGLLWVCVFQLFFFNSVTAALLGVAISLACLLSDLYASAFKRFCQVKDFSNLMPGHGGIMDRFDSLLLGVPAYYLLYLNWAG